MATVSNNFIGPLRQTDYRSPVRTVSGTPLGVYGGNMNAPLSGSVLGATATRPTSTRTATTGGGTPTSTTPTSSGPSREEQEVSRRESEMRNDINSGYSSYFAELDRQIGGLGAQQQGQEQIVSNNYNQGLSDINMQKQSSLGDLETQRRQTQEGQVSSLNDLSANIRNLFQTGNMKLGAMGAGDSSAANQYSYAIGKLGAKERGNIMTQTRSIENDIADRVSKLNNIVTQEVGKLKTNKDNQILQISQWFQDKQNELGQMKAQGQLQKGQSLASLSSQLLQVAQQRLMQVESDNRQQQQALQTWALSHASTIEQAKQAVGQQGNYQAAGVQAQPVNGQMNVDPTGNMAAYGYGNTSTGTADLRELFRAPGINNGFSR